MFSALLSGPTRSSKSNRGAQRKDTDVTENLKDWAYHLPFVTFKVESRLFKVPRIGLEKRSSLFRKRFRLPPEDSLDKPGTSDSNPLLIHDVKADEFRAFLSVLYPLTVEHEAPLQLSDQDWGYALTLAVAWGFEGVRDMAINALEKPSVDIITRIELGRENNIMTWLCPAYVTLALRSEPPTEAEAQRLGYNIASKLAIARERIAHEQYVKPGAFATETARKELALDVVSTTFGIPRIDPAPAHRIARDDTEAYGERVVMMKASSVETTGVRGFKVGSHPQASPSSFIAPLAPSSRQSAGEASKGFFSEMANVTHNFPETGIYYIINVGAKRIIDLPYGSMVENQPLIGWPLNKSITSNQQWELAVVQSVPVAAGQLCTIRCVQTLKQSPGSGGYMRSVGTRIGHSVFNEVWKLTVAESREPLGNQYTAYKLQPLVNPTDRILSLNMGTTTNWEDAILTLEDDGEEENKHWLLVPVTDIVKVAEDFKIEIFS